jgi:YfiH family protein
MTPPTTFAVEARALHGVPIVTWPAFAGHPLDAIVTTRDRGVTTDPSADLNLSLSTGDDAARVLANRELVARALDATLDDFVFGAQVHRPSVQVVTEEHRGQGARTFADAIPATDALVTTVPGIVLAVLVADCVPLVLFDPVRRVLACVHGGWRGTVSGVTTAAVATMRELGTDPADLLVGIGPSIAPDRYQVGADVVDAATAAFPDHVDQVVRADGTGGWTFDLWRANTLQLLAAGVRESRVQLAGLDTGPGTPYFSHRSEVPCGRFGAFARLTGEPR